ncbi:MAG: PD-(D/E)XK nuclease family protein [Pseudomonadota bacterium]|nr:hypothetical protein [Gammaproteobacteria bacterium]MEE2683699.1 PD-(D/E)XK nuclease family protein [Pseudomonadota bacterium]|tara:strand:+ start:219 stop:974 length:756 start_codon:yes stop_codon:yes gene_type:complete
MSSYYKGKRSRNIYNPNDAKPFKLSRSKIDRFIECPRCFYIDRRLGVDRPPGFPFNLNSAVDTLLKNEFDAIRIKNAQHPFLSKQGVDAKPAQHEQLDKWRENFVGVQYLHEDTSLIITGAIDDLWQNSKGEYIVVDYKSTSKKEKIEALDQGWHAGYKRQMEIYQWLLRKNDLVVSDIGYFLYANGITEKPAFEEKLEFDMTLIAYEGHDDWIDGTIEEIHACLNKDFIPKASLNCDYCCYQKAVDSVIF